MFEFPELKDLGEGFFEKLKEEGIYKEAGSYELNLEDGKTTYGGGYPITAIEKFLGYFDKDLNIAYFPSISFNTDFSYSNAFCRYVKEAGRDSVVLDGQTSEKYTERARKAMNYFKNAYSIGGSFQFYVRRAKKYEDAKGLGESAAIAASVSRALVRNVFGEKASEDDPLVSRFARLASGSGTRSSTGRFSLWISYPWIAERKSHGMVLPVNYDHFYFAAVPDKSEILTESAHSVAMSSMFYFKWAFNKYESLNEILEKGFSLDILLPKAEADMFLLNSLLMSKGVIIQNERSIPLINRIKEFKKKNEGLYFTADTGPSLVLLSQDKSLIEEFLSKESREYIIGKVPGSPPKSAEGKIESEAKAYFEDLEKKGLP